MTAMTRNQFNRNSIIFQPWFLLKKMGFVDYLDVLAWRNNDCGCNKVIGALINTDSIVYVYHVRLHSFIITF